MRRGLALALALAVVAAPAEAQGRFPRKWLLAGVGAAVSGTLALIYANNFEGNIGGCSSVACVVPVTVGFGTAVGFMIGNEMDKLHRARYGHAPPLSLRGMRLALTTVPNDLALSDSAVFVMGAEAVEMIGAGPEMTRLGLKARGLRGIGPVVPDPVRNSLLVGTAVGLYRFPLATDELGTLAYPGDISALSGDGSLVAAGVDNQVRLLRLGDSLQAVADSFPVEARVVDLVWEGSHRVWALTEDALTAIDVSDSTTMVPRGSFAFPTVPRRLALADSIGLVAAGSGGVYAVDLRDPDHPAELFNWSGARFVYDVAVLGSRVYAAAGPEGLYVLELTATGFTPVGLSRNLGFVAAVEAGPDAVYLLDRSGLSLRRVPVPAAR